MPAAAGSWAGVKIAGVAPGNAALGLPRITGSYLLLDGATLQPRALLDGAALTALRTPAVSALAVRHLTSEERPLRVVLFGSGPQAYGHVDALLAVRKLASVTVVARDPGRAAALAGHVRGIGVPEVRTGTAEEVAEADLVVCCTTAREPLFDGRRVAPGAVVVAVGSHEPDARETDTALVRRSEVWVEARAAALREAGDLLIPEAEGAIGSRTPHGHARRSRPGPGPAAAGDPLRASSRAWGWPGRISPWPSRSTGRPPAEQRDIVRWAPADSRRNGVGDLKQHSLIKAQERLRDQVGHALRAALTAGELKPGTVYSAPGLAAELGVSATPVREAMLDLAREGLVEPVRNKGFRITEVSERELDQCTELRMLIEVPTVGRVTETATAEQLEALRPLAEEIVVNARAHNLIGYLEADRQFHLTLLGLGGNDRLVETVGDLRKRSRLYGLTGLDEAGKLVSSAEEHVELLDLMIARDRAGAEACMMRHLGHVRSLWAEARDEPVEPATGALRSMRKG
ncbi:hypothetical protein Shyd_70770 [Streptomyces hydrogenans]|uniref:HTH gntR-type domain-containing protein n=1 Tax=Streptomyces hydrogenans TaxID=1873719 RepID=A0ABQ3PKZ9_9ACTN|nr:hypothetical protein Shyd_70770 [Streptomyces hydrogenans]